MKRFLRYVQTLNKVERNAYVTISAILAVCIAYPFLSQYIFDQKITVSQKIIYQQYIAKNDEQKKLQHKEYMHSYNQRSDYSSNLTETDAAVQPFLFNPNTVTEQELQQMKLPEQLVNNWLKFRNSGAVFYKADDVKKIYGISDELYETLEPFLQFDQTNYSIADLNTTDSATLTLLKNIGPTFAKRIILYRNLLGGYHNVSQLKEIYGMKSETYESIKNQITIKSEVKKININTVDEKSLSKHPYFAKKAKLIINYRTQHGPFISAEDFKNIHVLNDSLIEKQKAYIEF